VLLIIGSSRDEDGKFIININKIKYTVSSLVNKEKDDSNSYDLLSDDLTPVPESKGIDDWDDEPTPFIPPSDDDEGLSAADDKMAQMDAKMAQMDAKMAELNEKEEQLARIAEKADTIDFDTIGVATSADGDNLNEISGIGEFIGEKLNALGIYQFQQIANMTPEIEDQVNEAIEFFPGRIKRDNWVVQAAELAGAPKQSIDQIDDDDEWFE
jgi:predicted flap endonuclease-1-like 5' DNA nuclease